MAARVLGLSLKTALAVVGRRADAAGIAQDVAIDALRVAAAVGVGTVMALPPGRSVVASVDDRIEASLGQDSTTRPSRMRVFADERGSGGSGR